jgi:outer membrane receptor protein involved in Fe transport
MSSFARKAILSCGGAAIAILCGSAAWAQAKTFDVPSEDAVNSIPEFARQAGVQIVAPADQLEGHKTGAIKGTYDVRAGLAKLLQGTGLQVAASDDQTILLRAPRKNVAAAPATEGAASPREVQPNKIDPSGDIESVTVTGTSIRGVAPIGSNLVAVGRDSLEKTAAINATELTDTIPAITQSGGAAQGENAYSYYAPSIHGLGGSASNTTLVIVDGMRMPGGGTQFGQTDPNIIPSSALQRVEVLADGASSVYGSDAVAGVVNYITRREFQGLEINGKVGVANGWNSGDANAIWGEAWNTGSMYVAGQYSYQSALANSSRAFLDRGDYRPQGQNFETFNCSPASIRTAASGTNAYLSPSATTTVPNTSAYAPCNNTLNGDVLPSAERISGMVRVVQNIGDRLTLTGTADYGHLLGNRNLQEGLVTGITVFGPGSGMGGQINPFFQAPAGEPGATQENISYSALLPGLRPGSSGNAYGIEQQSNDTLFLYGNAEYKLSDNWTAKLSDSFGRSRTNDARIGAFCPSCAILALNGTTNANASTTTTSVGGANIIALNLPLTTGNALDVWNANGGNSSAATLKQLYSLNQNNTHWNSFNQSKLEIQGIVADLPAGPLRMAAGAEYMWVTQDVATIATGGLGALGGSLSKYFQFSLARNVYSGYAELVAPIVSDSMGIPLMKSFDIDLSARYDRYSDVGETSNPKIAANWTVYDDLKLRANYATAFVAPPLAAIGIPADGYKRIATGVTQLTTLINVPVSLYPQVVNLPGCAGATTTCQLGSSVNPGLSRTYGIGPTARPETGNSWSVGFDYTPSFLPGFTSSVTLWNNRFKSGADALGLTQEINIPSLNRLTLCPSGCSAAQINAFTNIANGGTLDSTLPATVYFLRNDDLGNVVNLRVQGVDLNSMYDVQTDRDGEFRLGLALTWFTKFTQDFPGVAYSMLGTSGSNNTFPSVAGHARLQGGWTFDQFSFDTFVNYTSAYHNWSNTSLIPVISNSVGVPIGGGDHVDANVTLDMHGEYNFGQTGWFGDTAVYIDVKNVLNSDPPFYSGNTAGIGLGGYGYNGFLSNPIGRIFAVGFRSDF